MKRFLTGILYGFAAYGFFAVAGFFLVLFLTTNSHDAQTEAAMTAAFLIGPFFSLIGFIFGCCKKLR